MKRLLTAAALVLFATTAHAGSKPALPYELHGNWCQIADRQDEYQRKHCPESDGTLTVTAKGFTEWESGCKLISIRFYSESKSHQANFKCGGEGSVWDATYHIGINNDGQLFMVETKRSKDRPE